MKITRVYTLETPEDVSDFCKVLRRLKKLAPGSLRYEVAVTAERNTTVKEFTDGPGRPGQRNTDPISTGLDVLSKRL